MRFCIQACVGYFGGVLVRPPLSARSQVSIARQRHRALALLLRKGQLLQQLAETDARLAAQGYQAASGGRGGPLATAERDAPEGAHR